MWSLESERGSHLVSDAVTTGVTRGCLSLSSAPSSRRLRLSTSPSDEFHHPNLAHLSFVPRVRRGEIIGNAVADKREKMYEEMQIGSDYMFRVDEARPHSLGSRRAVVWKPNPLLVPVCPACDRRGCVLG